MSYQKHLMVRLAVDQLGAKRKADQIELTPGQRVGSAPALLLKNNPAFLTLARSKGLDKWVSRWQRWSRLATTVLYRERSEGHHTGYEKAEVANKETNA